MSSRQITALDVTNALGSAVLQAANNLSDLTSTLTALGNLGAAPAASPVLSGTVTFSGIEARTGRATAAVSVSGSTLYPYTAGILILTGANATPFTITLPTTATIVDGQVIRVTSSAPTVTTLTVSPSSGQSVAGAPTTISPSAPFALIWIASLSTWVRL